MTLNFPGPQQLRIFYTIDAESLGALQHVMQLNFISAVTPLTPGTAFVDIDVVKAGSGQSHLEVTTDDLVVLLKALLAADDATIDYAECWQFDVGTFDATYISSYTIGVAGTAVVAATAAAEAIYSFRSQEGGNMRVVLMELSTPPGASLGYSDLNAANQAWVDHFKHATLAPYVARDTSYPIAFTRLHPGQSEALFKKRYRN